MNKFAIIGATFLGVTVVGATSLTNSGREGTAAPLGPVAAAVEEIVTPGFGNIGDTLSLSANQEYWESRGMS